ncbi:MAG: Lrp/AsnC family transcriptional regulator [Candidatus Micrarchaeota archaeon]|nr:Lrp/AsnC family transcriptional regulator [Candidatus Micrarchaeota archaeon]
MQQSIKKLDNNETKFLISLLEAGNKTDTKIAKEIHLSKATVNRIRKRLELQGIITDCIPILNLDYFGVNMFAVVLFEWRDFDNSKETQAMESEFSKTPQVVYFSVGESSSNLNYVAMLGFFDMADYHAFFNEFRKKYQSAIGKIEVFFIPSKRIIKQDFTDLAKLVLKKSEVYES